MDKVAERVFHKLAANRKELARRRQRRARTFAQSRDIWEDRASGK
jgi:predicted PhzF superfamily epimerase YddE/YHI9